MLVLAWLLGGCAADEMRRQDEDEEPRAVEPNNPCGSPPACEGAFTGATCDLPCLGGSSSACGLDVYCHSNGAVYGLATREAVLYRAAPDDDDHSVEQSFEGWVVGHAADLGLEPGLEPANLELHRLEGFRSGAGPLTIFRFAQTYDGWPVLAPDGIVTLVYGPQGAISTSGAIVDNRVELEHRYRQASQAKAEHSMLEHARGQLGEKDLEVVHATPAAMPAARSIVWVGLVREATGGGMLAQVIVEANPVFPGAVLPLVSYRELDVSELKDTQPIQVRALDPSGNPGTLAYEVEGLLTTDGPLLGSVYDATSEIQLADERVVVLDMHGERHEEIELYATRFLNPNGEFIEEDGTELTAQVAYHLFQSWYDFIDGRLTDPETGAKRWDSASYISSHGVQGSDTPPGTYSPRVLAEIDINSSNCPVQGNACASVTGYGPTNTIVDVFPELLHIPDGASKPEAIGQMKLPGTGIEPVLFAHEFGHIIDLFTGGGMTQYYAPACVEPCVAKCEEDTTDEVPALTESIASILSLVFLLQSFDGVDFEYCPIVDLVSTNGSKAWTPGSCIPPGEDISLFQRDEACSKDAPYCDKPEDPGFNQQCCFDNEDPTRCTIWVPDQCEVGGDGPNGGVGTGWARTTPTGLCDYHGGYRTNSLFQAFWQMLNGQRCEPTPPFACESFEWAHDVAPLDATTDALLYALRVNSLTYEQFFDAMATYISCTYGIAAYVEFNEIACNHGIRGCGDAPPLRCESCGNGVREGNEECDGTDWKMPRCEDMPVYSGGTLTCDQDTCMLDESQCSMPGLDTTAGTGMLEPDGSTSLADTESPRMGPLDDGCGCRAGARGWPLALLSFLMLGARRRRRCS